MRPVVAGIGNAIMDALVVVEDADRLVDELGLIRGTMHPVDHDQWTAAHDRVVDLGLTYESGGSCANTIAMLGRLGSAARYCGVVGNDALGRTYTERMTESCGGHALQPAEGNTGKCLSIVSREDAERTMLTDLGISTTLTDLGDFVQVLDEARVAHFTGYTLLGDPMRTTVLNAMSRVRDAGNLVSLDVADPMVVANTRALLWETIDALADIVFLNAEEARALTERAPEDAVTHIAKEARVSTVVVKLGARGSLVWQDGRVSTIDARRVRAIDTTGAGDAYAGGFLHGYCLGWSPDKAGALGSAVAAEVVSQLGAIVRDNSKLHALLNELA
jgi:sugar/nucleoside kinase (ribokinase family)